MARSCTAPPSGPRRAALIVALGALVMVTDRPPGIPGRAIAWLWTADAMAVSPPPAGLLPPFIRYGWCSPPAAYTTPERLREYRDAGMDVVLPGVNDTWTRASNFRRMDAAAAVGMRCWVADDVLDDPDPNTPAGAAALDSIVGEYVAHPGFLGFDLGDEPPESTFEQVGRLAKVLRARTPGHPIFNNLLGRASFATREQFVAYLNHFADAVEPSFLSADFYPFLRTGDRPLFVENLALLSDVARARGLPWFEVIQLIQHGPYRAVSEGELRWQAAHVLAYGGRGVCYFTYWTPPPDSYWNWRAGMIGYDGGRSPYYDIVRGINQEIGAAGGYLARSLWLATEHAGSVPDGGTPFAPGPQLSGVDGRAALGHFVDPDGHPLLFVVNSDSSAEQTIRLHLGQPLRWERMDLRTAGFVVEPGPDRVIALDLPPGGFSLLRVQAGLENRSGRPVLSLRPNPARGSVVVQVSEAVGPTRVELLDVSGRIWWSARGASGGGAWEWSGEGPAGRAPAGLYFARAEDARGVTAQKLVRTTGR